MWLVWLGCATTNLAACSAEMLPNGVAGEQVGGLSDESSKQL